MILLEFSLEPANLLFCAHTHDAQRASAYIRGAITSAADKMRDGTWSAAETRF